MNNPANKRPLIERLRTHVGTAHVNESDAAALIEELEAAVKRLTARGIEDMQRHIAELERDLTAANAEKRPKTEGYVCPKCGDGLSRRAMWYCEDCDAADAAERK